jgi:hypothetical protein
MWKYSGSALLTTAATALAISLGATASVATTATTWTVTPGGSFSGSSSLITFVDTTSHTVFTCGPSSVSGNLKSDSGLPGARIGTIAKLSFGKCSLPLGFTWIWTTSAFPWYLNANSYDATNKVTTGTVSGIHGSLSGPSCHAIMDGTTSTADNGMVTGKYTNSTGKLQIVESGSNLHFYKVSGCLNFIHTGDALYFSGTYSVTPVQIITSP